MLIKKNYASLLAVLIFVFTGCTPPSSKDQTSNSLDTTSNRSITKYASRFSISKAKGYTVLKLFGDRNSHQETAVFILYPKSQPKPDSIKNAYYIATPVERVAAMSSIYAAMLSKLGLEKKIVAIDNVDYSTNPFIIENVKNGRIKELSKGPEINTEQTLALKPELIFTFGMGNPEADINSKITQTRIPVAVSLDHLEETPLARAEWIKFFAAFFDKSVLADSLFTQTERNYMALKKLTDTVSYRPTVLTELKYGDAWYVPGGKSYMAYLLKDAGADYLWKEEDRTGSIPLTFETVFIKAQNCDYWLNLFLLNSKKELLAYDERYALFKAYKKGNLYNNNKRHNDKGYSDYWETGICNPDVLLEDLISIFHAPLLPGYTLKYYKRLE